LPVRVCFFIWESFYRVRIQESGFKINRSLSCLLILCSWF
jgi:hypothetical protein